PGIVSPADPLGWEVIWCRPVAGHFLLCGIAYTQSDSPYLCYARVAGWRQLCSGLWTWGRVAMVVGLYGATGTGRSFASTDQSGCARYLHGNSGPVSLAGGRLAELDSYPDGYGARRQRASLQSVCACGPNVCCAVVVGSPVLFSG